MGKNKNLQNNDRIQNADLENSIKSAVDVVYCPKSGATGPGEPAPGFTPKELATNRKVNVYTLGGVESAGSGQNSLGITKVASFIFSGAGDDKVAKAIEKVSREIDFSSSDDLRLERMKRIYQEVEKLQNNNLPQIKEVRPTMDTENSKTLKSPQANVQEDIRIDSVLVKSPVEHHKQIHRYRVKMTFHDGKTSFFTVSKLYYGEECIVLICNKSIFEHGVTLPPTLCDSVKSGQSDWVQPVKLEVENYQDGDKLMQDYYVFFSIAEGDSEISLIFTNFIGM